MKKHLNELQRDRDDLLIAAKKENLQIYIAEQNNEDNSRFEKTDNSIKR